MRIFITNGIFISILAYLLSSCSSLPISEDAQESIFREAKDKTFQGKGRDAVEQWKTSDDASLTRYVSVIGEKIRNETKISAMNYFVVDTPVVQAVSEYDSNTIYVTIGMLNSIENEAELACLLGHELHHQEQYQKNRKPEQSSSATSSVIDMITPDYLRGLGIKKDLEDFSYSNYSKSQETDADQQGSVLCARAGYDAFALTRLQNRLAAQIQNSPFDKIRNLKGTHDQLQDRAHDLSVWLKQNGYTDGTGKVSTTEYLVAFNTHTKNITPAQRNALTNLRNYEKEIASFKSGKKSISLNRIVQITSAVSKIIKQEKITPAELYRIASAQLSGDQFMQERVINAFNRYRSGHDAIISNVLTVLDALGRIAIGFTPLGSVIDFHDLLTGKDFFTGEQLSNTQRVISGIGLLIGQGQNFRRVESLISGATTEARTILRTSEEILSKETKPILGNKYVRDLPDLTHDGYRNAYEGAIIKGPAEVGDIYAQAQRAGQGGPGRWLSPVKPVNPEHAEELLNINKHENYAEQIKLYRIKERVSGYAGKVAGGEGHQFQIPDDVPLNEVLEEVKF